jgi:hypothetical protein
MGEGRPAKADVQEVAIENVEGFKAHAVATGGVQASHTLASKKAWRRGGSNVQGCKSDDVVEAWAWARLKAQRPVIL